MASGETWSEIGRQAPEVKREAWSRQDPLRMMRVVASGFALAGTTEFMELGTVYLSETYSHRYPSKSNRPHGLGVLSPILQLQTPDHRKHINGVDTKTAMLLQILTLNREQQCNVKRNFWADYPG